MEKASNVSQNHVRGWSGENRAFAECLAAFSQVKIQRLLCWSRLCCYKSTDFFCVTSDLQHCKSLTVFLGLQLPRSCIFSPRHTQETSLSIITQQVVYLLKTTHEDTACSICALISEYSLFSQGWEQKFVSNWHPNVLCNLLFRFWSHQASLLKFLPSLLTDKHIGFDVRHICIRAQSQSYRAGRDYRVCVCVPTIPQQDSMIAMYV